MTKVSKKWTRSISIPSTGEMKWARNWCHWHNLLLPKSPLISKKSPNVYREIGVPQEESRAMDFS